MPETDGTEQVSNTELTEAMETSIGDKLAAFKDADEGIEAPAEADTAESQEQEDDDSETLSEPAPDEEGPSDDSEPVEQLPTAPTLPAAQVRSLVAYGWSEAEIAEAMETPNFAATAARIHQNRTQEIQAWAAQGRMNKQGTEQEQTGHQQVPQQLDVDALKEKFGSEELIDELVGPMNAALAELHTMMPQLQAGQQAVEQERLDAARDTVELFFSADNMSPYTSAYGDAKTMTEEQYGNRADLLQMTDNIRTGASMRGQEMTINEAMGYAHEMISGSFKTEAARKEISGKVRKRSSGMSLKPGTQISAKNVPGGNLSVEQIETNARRRLDALGQ